MRKHDVQARSGFLYLWDVPAHGLSFSVVRYNQNRDPDDEDDGDRPTCEDKARLERRVYP